MDAASGIVDLTAASLEALPRSFDCSGNLNVAIEVLEEKTFQIFRKRAFTKFTEQEKAEICNKHEYSDFQSFNEKFPWKYATFKCHRHAKPSITEKKARPQQWIYANDCKCHFSVIYKPDKNCYVFGNTYDFRHNHSVKESDYMMHPKKRRLEANERQFVAEAMTWAPKRSKVTSVIREMTGKCVLKKDIDNAMRSINASILGKTEPEKVIELLKRMKNQDSQFYYSIKHSDEKLKASIPYLPFFRNWGNEKCDEQIS